MKDPGWRPAIAIAVRIATLRSVESDLLITLRGMTLFAFTTSVLLVPVSYLVTLGSVSSGSSVAASFVVGAVVVTGTISLVLGTRPPRAADHLQLAALLFRSTTLRVLLGASLGGVGVVGALVSGNPALGLVGTSCAVVMVALAAPTRRRVDAWQEAVDGTGLSVRAALEARYRRR